MSAALRPYVTAGIALVGASIISVTPIAPSQIASNSDVRVSNASVDLVANVISCAGDATSSAMCEGVSALPSFMAKGTPSAFQTLADAAGPSIFNVPANLLIALANVPYNFLTALGTGDDGTGHPLNLGSEPNSGFSFVPNTDNILLTRPLGQVVGLTSDLNFAGNIWVYSPTNVLGTDPGDIARYQALANVFLPIPALSVGLGNIFASIAASQLPMNAGCTGTGAGACPNVFGILGDSLQLQNVFKLFSPEGYTFPEVRNPITCSDTGQCDILNPDGPLAPQSNQNVKLDLSAPFANFYSSLTQTPDYTKIKLPTFEMAVTTLINVAKGFNTFLNPFVLGTQCGLCALVVPNPNNLPVPGPTNPGTTSFPTPSLPTPSTTLALAADDLGAAAKTDGNATSSTAGRLGHGPLFKTVLSNTKNTEPTQTDDAEAVNAAVTTDPPPAANTPDQATTTPSIAVTKPKPGPKHAKTDNGLAGALKGAFSKPFKGLKSGGASDKTESTSTGVSTPDTSKAPKAPKVPRASKAPKVSSSASSNKGGESGSGSTGG